MMALLHNTHLLSINMLLYLLGIIAVYCISCIDCDVVLPTGTSSGASSPTRKEQPLFSLRQVGMICERLLKEREDKIREEYDEILTTKLAGVNLKKIKIKCEWYREQFVVSNP